MILHIDGDINRYYVQTLCMIFFPDSILNCILKIAIGMVALKFGGDFIVDNSIIIAESLGISEKVIS
ncbi:MAG: hypothetical protein IKJ04_03755, partial [Clostridia bacterium]|nr:hypothetical protein [Clostridia bacterium]